MARQLPRFHRFVGHRDIVEFLQRQLDGALARNEPFPASLFAGPSGVGKTLLAEGLAQEYGTKLIRVTGDRAKEELAVEFIKMDFGDFIFIDEAHRLRGPSQELLLDILDLRKIGKPNSDTAGNDPKTEVREEINIEPCTLILATDQPGKLINALLKRMVVEVSLDYYPLSEMKMIVDRLATDLNLLVSAQAARLIAEVSRGVPRVAKLYLQLLRFHFPDSETRKISCQQVRSFLTDRGIDDKGLHKVDRRYLRYLREKERAALESLALRLGSDCDYVRRQIEPFLLREDLIVICSGGRRLTEEGKEWIAQHNH